MDLDHQEIQEEQRHHHARPGYPLPDQQVEQPKWSRKWSAKRSRNKRFRKSHAETLKRSKQPRLNTLNNYSCKLKKQKESELFISWIRDKIFCRLAIKMAECFHGSPYEINAWGNWKACVYSIAQNLLVIFNSLFLFMNIGAHIFLSLQCCLVRN